MHSNFAKKRLIYLCYILIIIKIKINIFTRLLEIKKNY